MSEEESQIEASSLFENLSREELIEKVKRFQAENVELKHRLTYDQLGLVKTSDEGRGFIFRNLWQARQEGKGVALLRLDMNGLKEKNSRLGHEVVDEKLEKLATNLWEIAGDKGLAIRFHAKGDEFGILLLEEDNLEEKEALLRQGFDIEGERFTMSVGVATMNSQEVGIAQSTGEIWDRLAKEADIAERREKSGN